MEESLRTAIDRSSSSELNTSGFLSTKQIAEIYFCLAFVFSLVGNPVFARENANTATGKKNQPRPSSNVQKTSAANSGKNLPTKSAKQVTAKTQAPRTANTAVAAKAAAPAQSRAPSSTANTRSKLQIEAIRNLYAAVKNVQVSTGPGTGRLDESVGLTIDNQYLLMPLDFVLGAWLSRSDLHFFVDESHEARVVDLDLGNNLALLHVDQPMLGSISRSQIRNDIPAAGEPLAVVDVKDSLRSGPRFVASVRDGDSIRYEIVTSGAFKNGGFLFDRSGRLVSVVPAASTQKSLGEGNGNGKAWASSTQSIFEILHRQDTPKPASLSGVDERHKQLVTWQEHWAQSLVPTKQLISTQKLDCHNRIASISEQSVASQIRQMNAMGCEARTSIPLGGNYSAGFELKTGNIVLREPSLSDPQTLLLAKTYAADYFSDLEQSSKSVNLMTNQECQENKVTNKQGHAVQIKFCTSALKTDQGLNDTVIAVSSVDSGSHAYVVAAHLKGFDQGNTKKVMEAMIENGGSLK
jgi:hypothetical protein